MEDIKEIIQKYRISVASIVKSITGSKNEDLEQEVFIKTWKNMGSYQEKGKLTQWIHTIARNISRDYLRSKSFRQEKLQDNDEQKILDIKDYRHTPEGKIALAQRQKIIIEAINNLPKAHKEVVLLFDIEELTYEEISQKLQCPIGTVKSRLFNARKKLSLALSDLMQ